MARREAKGKRKVAKEKSEQDQTHCSVFRKGDNNKLYAIDEDDSGNVEEATDNEKICKHGVCWKNVKIRSGKK